MDISVSMTLRCNLFNSSGRLVFDGILQSPRKAEFSKAFVGVGRLIAFDLWFRCPKSSGISYIS